MVLKEWTKKHIEAKAWAIFVFTSILAFWAWAKLGTNVSNIYHLFPLFGLIGFSTMWGHYMVWALREWSGADSAKTAMYSKVTHWVVLLCIVVHPSLIIYKLSADGFGLPPASYKAYVGAKLAGFVLLGTLCLFAFLAFELEKWLHTNTQVWKTILVFNHLAMLGIVVHALKLGQSVKQAPLKYIWPIYGITLVGIYIYLASKKKLI